MMTFGALKTAVFRRLEESSSSPVFWSETDVEDALNDGYAELADATEWHERWLSVDLLDTRPWYDARTVLGTEVLTVGAAYNDQTSRWLEPGFVRDLDRRDRRWEQVHVGEPSRILQRGLWWFSYWPRSDADSGTVKQYFTALPTPLSDDLDEPGLPMPFHDGLVAYALADLWAQDAETDLALASWQTYLGYETGLQAWVNDRLSVPRVHGHAG